MDKIADPHKREHERAEDCDLEYESEAAAPGIGVHYRCQTCGRPWLQVGGSYYDPREQIVVEQSPEDLIFVEQSPEDVI